MNPATQPAATFAIWRRTFPDNWGVSAWFLTSHRVTARSDKEAQSKVRRMFRGADFHSMSIVAIPLGTNPNDYDAANLENYVPMSRHGGVVHEST